MVPLINLLPWRTRRRSYRLKLWGGILLLGMVLIVVLIQLRAKPLALQSHRQQAQARAMSEQRLALKARLLRQQTQLKENQRLWDIVRQEAVIKASIARWERVLNGLAATLPENSWLRSVSWQNEKVTLSGVAGDAHELRQLETALGTLPGAFRVEPGALHNDKPNGIVFTFALISSGGARAEHP